MSQVGYVRDTGGRRTASWRELTRPVLNSKEIPMALVTLLLSLLASSLLPVGSEAGSHRVAPLDAVGGGPMVRPYDAVGGGPMVVSSTH